MQEDAALHFRVVMPPVLESVGRARREFRDAATDWCLPLEMVGDAALVVSELATNAVLHARTAFVVVVRRTGNLGIRVEVTDASSDPVLSPVPSLAEVPGVLEDLDEVDALLETLSDARTTGRGLSMVAKLCDRWGVKVEPSGKTVWAELGLGSTVGGGTQQQAIVAPIAVPAASRRVVLVAVPIRLAFESERHFEALQRELQLMALAGEGRDLAAVADEVSLHIRSLRHVGRQATRAAVARGDRLIDIELLVPPTADVGFRRLETLLDQVSAQSRAGRLLTEQPGEELNAFRRWTWAEIEGQLAGGLPRPCPFPTVPQRHPAPAGPRIADVDRQRRERVARLQATLSGVAERNVAADTVLAAAVATLAGLRGCLFLRATNGTTVRLAAEVGYPEQVVKAWQKFSLRTDVPASECIRTERIVMLPTPGERDRRYPAVGEFSISDDPSSVCVPLRTAAGAIGCLALSFRQGRALSPDQLSFLQDMADTAAEWFVAHQ